MTQPLHSPLNAFQKIVPEDADGVKFMLRKGAVNSVSRHFLQAHLVSTACAIGAIALSILSVPVYAVRSLIEFTACVLTLKMNAALIAFAHNMLNAGKSLLFVAIGIAYVAGGLIAPSKIYPYVYVPKNSEPKADEILQKQLDASLQKEKESQTQIVDVQKQLEEKKSEFTALSEKVQKLEADLDNKTFVFETQLKSKESQIEQLYSDVRSAQEEPNELRLKIAQMEEAQKQLEAAHEETIAKMEPTLREAISKARREDRQMRDRKNSDLFQRAQQSLQKTHEQQSARLKSDFETTKKELEANEKLQHQLKENLSERERANSLLKVDNKKLQTQLDAANTELSRLKKLLSANDSAKNAQNELPKGQESSM